VIYYSQKECVPSHVTYLNVGKYVIITHFQCKIETRLQWTTNRTFSTEVEFYWQKELNRVLCHLWGLRGNVHGSFMARWKARGRLPISAKWTFFAISHALGTMREYWSKSWCSKGGCHFELKKNFRGKRVLPTNECWRQKTRFPGLSRGVVCVILRLAILTQYRRVTDTHTISKLIYTEFNTND